MDDDILLNCIVFLTLGKTAYDFIHEFDDDSNCFQNTLRIASKNSISRNHSTRMDDIGDCLRSKLLNTIEDMFVTHNVFPRITAGRRSASEHGRNFFR